jgi:plastocyanin
MTWLSRICFSVACGAPLAAATVTARVELTDSREPSVRKQRDYSGVVLWLEPAGREAPAVPPGTYTMQQKGKRFIPHVLPIPKGSSVDFPNGDPIFHNAFSNFAGQPFDTGLYPPGTSKKITFRREGAVRVFCNIHSSMSAVILVLKTPWFAVSDASGDLRIRNVPPGQYRVRIWHERAPAAALQGLERRITVAGDDDTLPLFRISELGYLEVPHQNKHGMDYPAESADVPLYPGARK